MGNIFTDLFSSDDAQKAAAAAAQGYQTGATTANNTLTGAQTSADALYGQAQAPYNSLIASTGAGSSAYGDATGANGADGLARAKALYQSDPGYNGGLTTGIDQVMRTNAAAGNLGGGNNSADEIKFASDYDANKYGQYVSSLAPYLGANASAISGNAGVLGNEATTNTAIAGQQAQNSYNSSVGAGNATAQGDMAPYQASANFWSALTGLGNTALKASGIGGFAPSGSGGGGGIASVMNVGAQAFPAFA
jgi:hypothetical protein